MSYQLLQGDCLDAMAGLPSASVDALICDPPAGISFMSRDFDSARGGRDKWIAWLAERLAAARRVLKPGHYALVWALPRTSHWTGMACEDAGFIVIDRVSHIFGSGFPKGKNKLKPAVEDWWLIRSPGPAVPLHIDACRVGTNDKLNGGAYSNNRELSTNDVYGTYRRLSPEQYQAPAGRWPPNLILSHSSGCIPIGVKRVKTNIGWKGGPADRESTADWRYHNRVATSYADAAGREEVAAWECQPGCPIAALDEQSGVSTQVDRRESKKHPRPRSATAQVYGVDNTVDDTPTYNDTGGASRFYPNLDPPDEGLSEIGLRTEWECQPGCPVRELDQMSGELTSGALQPYHENHSNASSYRMERDKTYVKDADTGGASRYYPNLDPPEWECQDGCPIAALDEQSGKSTDRNSKNGVRSGNNQYFVSDGGTVHPGFNGDTGGASRFYPNLDPPDEGLSETGLRTEWECQPGCPVLELDQMSGELTSGGRSGKPGNGPFLAPVSQQDLGTTWEGDTGGASRYYPNLDPPFFYAAKSSRSERNRGCDGLYWRADDTRGSGYRPITRAEYDEAAAWNVAHEDDRSAQVRIARGNIHPTVKNIKLLSWLINLLTVPGDTILDPFAGSGSIGVAAIQGGRSFVGVEMDEDYLTIAERRLAHAAEMPRQMEIAV